MAKFYGSNLIWEESDRKTILLNFFFKKKAKKDATLHGWEQAHVSV